MTKKKKLIFTRNLIVALGLIYSPYGYGVSVNEDYELGRAAGRAEVLNDMRGATDPSGCEDLDNEFISPELGLCSVHAYNIGNIQNPGDEAGRILMQDVVALKTTVITQQMYAQYETLKNTVDRLKQLLEKEVLLTQLRVASGVAGGGSGASSDNNGSSGNNSNTIAGIEDCQNKFSGDIDDILKCESRNLSLVSAAAANNRSAAKKQLQIDIGVISGFDVRTICESNTNNQSSNVGSNPGTLISNCNVCKNASKRTDIEQCVTVAQRGITSKLDDRRRENNSLSWGRR